MEETRKRRRMSGLALRVAARLAETPGPKRLLYSKAIRDLGLVQMHEIRIPPEVVPFRPLHLGSPVAEGGQRG